VARNVTADNADARWGHTQRSGDDSTRRVACLAGLGRRANVDLELASAPADDRVTPCFRGDVEGDTHAGHEALVDLLDVEVVVPLAELEVAGGELLDLERGLLVRQFG